MRASGLQEDQLADSSRVPFSGRISNFDRFDHDFFGVTPREAAMIDPQQRILLECVWHALEDAGEVPGAAARVGIFGGVGAIGYALRRVAQLTSDATNAQFGMDKDFAMTRVSYKLDLRGPAISVQTACSTSLVATHLAVQSLLSGECRIAIAAGATVLETARTGYPAVEGLLAPDGVLRAFDADAKGVVPGEGVAVVVLKRLDDARADRDRIYAVIRGSAVNNDGHEKVSYAAPGVNGQTAVVSEALAFAGVDAASVGMLEAHGTGTALGDAIEVSALTRAYRAHTPAIQFCALGSAKTNVGHTDAAAGAVGLIKAALCLHHATLVPSLHFTRANPALSLATSPFFVNTESRPWSSTSTRRAGVSAFGIGGTNAHAVLEEYRPPPRETSRGRRAHVFELSAHSDVALDAARSQLITQLEQTTPLDADDLADLEYTLRIGRKRFRHRMAVTADDTTVALRALRAATSPDRAHAIAPDERPPLCFAFPGAGAHRIEMGIALYERETVFRRAVDECLAHAQRHTGLDVRAILYPSSPGEAARAAMETPAVFLSAIFAIEYGLATLLDAWGIRADLVMGHSAGEYVAAAVAGVLSLEDAIALDLARVAGIEALPPAAMLSIAGHVDSIRGIADACNVDIAIVNSPQSCVAVGATDAIDRLALELTERRIETRKLRVAGASHCRLVEPLLRGFDAALARVQLRTPKLRFISSITGDDVTDRVSTAAYWREHFRHAVNFERAAVTVLADSKCVVLEVGPGTALQSFVRQTASAHGLDGRAVISTMRRSSDETDDDVVLARAIGALFVHGITVDPGAYYAGESRRKRDAPLLAFARHRHWLPPDELRAEHVTPADEYRDASTSSESESSDISATTESETRVLAIWSKVLGREIRSIEADYFQLGGTSLQGLALKREIDRQFSIQLPISGLIEHPTIRSMAAWIDSIRSDSRGVGTRSAPITEIASGAEPALFLVHGGGGEVLDFRHARTAFPQRAVRAIRDFVTGEPDEPKSLEAQAKRYVDVIRNAQPRGPYLLGGHSFGGLLATEMATQLRAAGERVALLVLLDAIDIGGIDRSQGASYLDGLMRSVLGQERADSDEAIDRYLADDAEFATLGLDVDREIARRLVHATRANTRRARAYRVPEISGRVLYLRARDRSRLGIDRPETAFIDAARDGLTVRVVAGDHWSMLESAPRSETWDIVARAVHRALGPGN